MHLFGPLRIFPASVWTKTPTQMQAPHPNSIAHENRLFTVSPRQLKSDISHCTKASLLMASPQFVVCFRRVPHTTAHCEPVRNVLLTDPSRHRTPQGSKHHFILSFSPHHISDKTQSSEHKGLRFDNRVKHTGSPYCLKVTTPHSSPSNCLRLPLSFTLRDLN